MQLLPIKRALISVTDKTGAIDLASFLTANGVEIISTGGTKKAIEAAGIAVTSVSDVTGFPEILGGRVKTLHPHIHGGILASKDNQQHMDTLAALNLAPFDLICVNLYNFENALANHGTLAETIEEIDIGGPCLLRAAAKNFQSVLVLPDPDCYQEAISELQRNNMRIGIKFRQRMAFLVFERTSRYDAMIAGYLRDAPAMS